MFDWLKDLLYPTDTPDISQSFVVLLLAIGSGILLGRVKIGKVSLGVAGVMFTGLILGHLGYGMQESILHFMRDMGLIFFVYAIGIQVGPSFFSAFKNEGIKFNLLAVSGVLFAGVVTYVLFGVTGLSIENLVGIMSGSVTNTPGLGAAKNTLQELKMQFPDRTFADPAMGYAIAYPLGVFGIIGMVILAKILLKIDPDAEMRKFRMMKINREEPLLHKKCRVNKPEVIGKSIYQVIQDFGKDVVISRLKHSGEQAVFSPTLDTRLRDKDVVMVVGQEKDVDEFIRLIGRESTDAFIESEKDIQNKTIFVTQPHAVHKKLLELDLYNKYDLKVTRVYRSGREILARPSLELFYGDRLRVVGSEESIQKVEGLLGNSERKLLEPDFLSLFGGLLLGVLLGAIPIVIPSLPVPIKLGLAAGPLLVALVISRFGGISFIHSYLNIGATHFMKDLGICLFFGAVGIQAGENFYDNFILYNGWLWLLYGSFITFIPLIFIVVVGRFLMKLNFLQLVGIMSGAYTDPAALTFSTNYLNSDVPVQSYATVYPLATIFRILVAQLLIILLV